MPPYLWPVVLCTGVAYLIGAIPFGYLVARAKGVDLFQVGSGNIGATNVGRVLGKRYGALVFVLDFAKGAVPVLLLPGIAADLFPEAIPAVSYATLQVAAAIGAFLGHLFPVYLGFRGGKGVATGCGTVFVLVLGPASVAILVWLAAVAAWRTVSLASVLAVSTLVGARLLGTAQPFQGDTAIKTWFCIGGAALIIVKHVGNLHRLRAGTENKLRDIPMWHNLGKSLHVTALGVWVGAAVFFNFIAAPAIFESFKEVVQNAPSDRTAYLPLAPEASPEQRAQLASALAGSAVGPLFPRLFALQAICGLLAVMTALGWWRELGRVHRWRVYLLVAALVTVAVGWPVSEKVSELRLARFSSDSALASEARAAFGPWHGVSLVLSLVTAVLALIALALAARLPAQDGASKMPNTE